MAQKLVIDCSTGNSEYLDFTSEEIAAQETTKAEAKTQREAEEAAATQAATDKASGNAKLKALGLTDEEIAALVG
jgi:hypothetical protein|eukprot:COSAG02_NODE_17048_length_1032_cov_3.801061_2_plen_75_part_00